MEQDLQQNLGLEDQRGLTVVKSNNIIQRSRFSLDVQEQKLILFLMSKIRPEDTEFSEYKFNMKELCDIMGISYNGKNYRDFRLCIQRLADKSFWIREPDREVLCRWIAKASIARNLDVMIQLDNDLKPYLLELYEHFTSYELEYILTMRSKYSIRMYELFKSYCNLGEFIIPLDELKKMLMTAEYTMYKDFRVRVVQPAIAEINRFTDIDVSFRPKRTSKKITHLIFSIRFKNTSERVNSMLDRKQKLNKYLKNK